VDYKALFHVVRPTGNASARWAKDLRTFLTTLHHLKQKQNLSEI